MKVVMIGDTQVGKTAVLERLTDGVFKGSGPPTIGAAFKSHTLETKKGCITLQIWDTAGQERFRSLTQMYYRTAHAAILFYDITNRDSFSALDLWCNELSSNGPEDIKIVVVGNKIDLNQKRTVPSEEAMIFSKKRGAIFYAETSAKTGEGIHSLFVRIAEEISNDPKANTSLQIDEAQNNKQNCC